MGKKKNILLVDDDSIYLFIAQKTIEEQFPNTVITICKNGQEALSKLDSFNPDVMLLDINMPIMNGWDLLEKLKEKCQKLAYPIFMVSSSIDENDRDRAESYEFVKGFMQKPISKEKFIDFKLNKVVL